MLSDQPASTQSVVRSSGSLSRELPTIGPYRAVSVLGQGGMGIVYLAEQSAPIRRQVALKLVRAGADSKEVITRFERERQALASVSHPNVAGILDAGQSLDGRPYFVMEYVEGIAITRFCDEHTLPNRNRIELLGDVCEAVQHAHDRGLIHRDIKPSNILVGGPPARPLAKVIDFGVAKAMGPGSWEDTFTTQVGQFVGTPAYMSPEQANLSAKTMDHRTDVYSLGVLMYEMLGGVLPFDFCRLKHQTFPEVQRMITEEDPIAPSVRLSLLGGESSIIAARRGTDPHRLRKELRGDLDWIVLKALEKDPSRRYPAASALREDLRRYLRHEPVSAGPPTLRYRARKFVRRRRRGIAAGCVGVVLLGLAAVTAMSVRGARREWVSRLFTEAQLAAYSNPMDGLQRFGRFVADFPDHIEARIQLAYLLAREGQVVEAQATAERIIVDEPDSGPAHLLLARLFRNRDSDRAERHRLEGQRLLPDDRYYSALALPSSEAKRAIALLSEILETDGAHFDARWNRAWRYSEIGDFGSMLKDAEILAAIRPKSSAAANLHGFALGRLRRLEEAERAYTRGIQLAPSHLALYLNLAEIHREQGRYAAAVEDCNRVIELDPGFGGAHSVRASIRLQEGKLKETLDDCEKALKLEPGNALAYWIRAKALQQQGATEAALTDFRAAIERDRRNSQLRFELGELYRQLGDDSAALEQYTLAVDLGSPPVDAFYGRGAVLTRMSSFAAAKADFDEAIGRRSDAPQYYNRRARVLRLLGEYDGALQDHDRAVALAPSAREPHANRAITRWFVRDLDGAAEDLERACSLDPARAAPYRLWLWQIATARGQKDASEGALNHAAEATASDWEAKLVSAVRGELSPEALLSLATDEGRRCDAYYYLGARALAANEPEAAAGWFQKCVAIRHLDYSEHDLALLHLAILAER